LKSNCNFSWKTILEIDWTEKEERVRSPNPNLHSSSSFGVSLMGNNSRSMPCQGIEEIYLYVLTSGEQCLATVHKDDHGMVPCRPLLWWGTRERKEQENWRHLSWLPFVRIESYFNTGLLCQFFLSIEALLISFSKCRHLRHLLWFYLWYKIFISH